MKVLSSKRTNIQHGLIWKIKQPRYPLHPHHSQTAAVSLFNQRNRLHRNICQISPNGQFVTVVGDSEYIIYTSLAWRNNSSGNRVSFDCAPDSNAGEYTRILGCDLELEWKVREVGRWRVCMAGHCLAPEVLVLWCSGIGSLESLLDGLMSKWNVGFLQSLSLCSVWFDLFLPRFSGTGSLVAITIAED